MKQAQQGDVIFRRIESIPQDSKPHSGNVVAEGEATGHAHRISTVDTEDFLLYEKEGTLYLYLETGATIMHEEHKPVTLEPGNWEIGQVLEYDYINEAIERVRD